MTAGSDGAALSDVVTPYTAVEEIAVAVVVAAGDDAVVVAAVAAVG